MCYLLDVLADVTNWRVWVLVLVIVFVVVIVTYLLAVIVQPPHLLVSDIVDPAKTKDSSADGLYYLPAASAQISATAEVGIFMSAQGIETARMISLQLTNTVTIEPDTTQLISISYKGSWFSNDEVRLSTNADGLIQNVSASSEDTLDKIIAELSEAPTKMLNAGFVPGKAPAIPPEKLIATLSFTKQFDIPAEAFAQSPIDKKWMVQIEREKGLLTADCSFSITFPVASKLVLASADQHAGILTRPLTKMKLNIIPSDPASKLQAIDYYLRVPDVTKIVCIPVKRSSFVKRVHEPKFNNGLFIENYINKPSEAEGFISIPVNMLKAIFSIPAQLLTFRIHNLQKEKELELAQQQLAAAKAISAKQEEAEKKLDDALQRVESGAKQQQETLSSISNKLNQAQAGKPQQAPPIPDRIFIEAIKKNQAGWKKTYDALSIDFAKKKVNGVETATNAIVFKTLEKLDNPLPGAEVIPPFIDFQASDGQTYRLPIDVQRTGGAIVPAFIPNPDENCDGNSPKHPGCSVSRVSNSDTGTIGLKVYKGGKPFILSCYHVLCSSELAGGIFKFDPASPFSDAAIISPGLKDNGSDTDVIGSVTDGVLTEYLDCAIASINDDLDVKARICRIDVEPSGTLEVTSAHVQPRMKVFMSGRTSQFQSAEVKSSYTSTDIQYTMGSWTLNGLIATTPLAREGDSGAVVFDEECKVIGIVAARSPTDTYIVPIAPILTEFGIKLKP